MRTFSEVKEWSRNGKEAVSLVMDGRTLTCRITAKRGKVLIDFDLFPGNHDLGTKASERLWQQYQAYCKAHDFRSRFHSHFSKTSIMFEVREKHGQRCLTRFGSALAIQIILSEFDAMFSPITREEATRAYFREQSWFPTAQSRRNSCSSRRAAFGRSLIELLQFDFEVLSTVPPRKLEEIVAAAYDRVGFDRVVLTPHSGDHGRDVIAEKDGWGTVRVIVQVKAYDAKNLVRQDEVRS